MWLNNGQDNIKNIFIPQIKPVTQTWPNFSTLSSACKDSRAVVEALIKTNGITFKTIQCREATTTSSICGTIGLFIDQKKIHDFIFFFKPCTLFVTGEIIQISRHNGKGQITWIITPTPTNQCQECTQMTITADSHGTTTTGLCSKVKAFFDSKLSS